MAQGVTSWLQIDELGSGLMGRTSFFQIEGANSILAGNTSFFQVEGNPIVVAPEAPSSVEANPTGGSTAELSLIDNSSNTATHRWQLAPVSTGTWVDATGTSNPTPIGVTLLNTTGLTPATEYLVRARSERDGLQSSYVQGSLSFWTDNTSGGESPVPELPAPGPALQGLRDLNQSFSGKRLCTTPRVGILASTVPSTGEDGGGYIYEDLTLPADANKLVRGFVTTFPTAGTFIPEEDTSFTFTGPDGYYFFDYELRVDDVPSGTARVYLAVGTATGELNVTTDSAVFSGSASNTSGSVNATISVTTENATFSGSASNTAGATAQISVTTDNASPAIYAVNIVTASVISVTTDNSTPNISVSINQAIATISVTTDNAVPNISAVSAVVSPQVTLTLTTEDCYINLSGYGALPPVIPGPEVRVPIPLSMTIDGKLLIVL